MRRLFALVPAVAALATALVVLPTVTTSAVATPRPVTARLTQLPLSGVDGPARASLRVAGTSAPLLLSAQAATAPYSLMGVTWDVDPFVTDVAVQVRHRSTGTWSPWEAVEAEGDDAPDAGSTDTSAGARAGTVPVWTGPSDGVQVRVDVPTGKAPSNVRVQLIDPGTSAADVLPQGGRAPRASAHASQPQPEIISRAQWGADESIRRGAPSYNSTVKVGFVHHTVNSNDYSPEQAAAVVRGIYAYHVKSNGWSDIGYNFLVDRFGRAYEGRAGGVDRFPVGAHTGGFNTDSFGVSLIGDYSTVAPATATVDTLTKVLAWKLGSAYRDPLGTATLTSAGGGTSRYAAGVKHTFDVVSGHRDAGTTSCPGQKTYEMMDEIRLRVNAELGAAFVEPALDGEALVKVGDRGPVALRARVLGPTDWTATVLAPDGAVLRSAQGTGGNVELSWDLTGADGQPVPPGSYQLALRGSQGADEALAYLRTVIVDRPVCRGTPLARARCRSAVRSAGLR